MEDTTSQASIEEATRLILQANLTRIEHRILVDFIKQATSPDVAAHEVLQWVGRCGGCPVEAALRDFKESWHNVVSTVVRLTPDPVDSPTSRDSIHRRDSSQCCVTPPDRQQLASPEPTFIIPPSLARLLGDEADPVEHDASRSLINAFMTPPGASRLRSMLSDTSTRGILANTWLLAPGVSDAFRNGHLQIQPYTTDWNESDQDATGKDLSYVQYRIMPLFPEPYENIPLADGSPFVDDSPYRGLVLQTEDPNRLPLPDSFLFKVHCKFVNALHHFRIEGRIAEGWPPRHSPSSWHSILPMVRGIWLLVPRFIRTFCYRRLLTIGKSRYPQDISLAVHQLPLGLYAKKCDRSQNNEPNALQLLERHASSIPAPRLIDSFQTAAADGGDDWFIMTSLPGVRVHDVLHRMSYAERDHLADDLSKILDEMHKIPNETPYLFANVSGGPVIDRRAGGGARGCGPYNSEADLNTQLAKGVEQHLRRAVPSAFSRTHESVFTHSDLFFSNVLVDGGRLSGIVDWEGAAFMPEYWEFTKAMRSLRLGTDAEAIYRRIWGHKFDEELEAEKWLWHVFPFGGPE